jgi:hypothetical protein
LEVPPQQGFTLQFIKFRSSEAHDFRIIQPSKKHFGICSATQETLNKPSTKDNTVVQKQELIVPTWPQNTLPELSACQNQVGKRLHLLAPDPSFMHNGQLAT